MEVIMNQPSIMRSPLPLKEFRDSVKKQRSTLEILHSKVTSASDLFYFECIPVVEECEAAIDSLLIIREAVHDLLSLLERKDLPCAVYLARGPVQDLLSCTQKRVQDVVVLVFNFQKTCHIGSERVFLQQLIIQRKFETLLESCDQAILGIGDFLDQIIFFDNRIYAQQRRDELR
jgi:hypothetical protein